MEGMASYTPTAATLTRITGTASTPASRQGQHRPDAFVADLYPVSKGLLG